MKFGTADRLTRQAALALVMCGVSEFKLRGERNSAATEPNQRLFDYRISESINCCDMYVYGGSLSAVPAHNM